MIRLENAKMSPRIENGTIFWYEGDGFSLSLTLELTDADGESVDIAADDEITITFEDKRGEEIKTFEFENVENNTVTLKFTDEVTALFKAGKYKYDITIVHGGIRTTLAKGNDVIVE